MQMEMEMDAQAEAELEIQWMIDEGVEAAVIVMFPDVFLTPPRRA